MYRWRRLSEKERLSVLEWRVLRGHPTHSPHHVDSGKRHYHLTAACFEHQAIIGTTVERMNHFAQAWLDILQGHSLEVNAWALLPNHYHALVMTEDVIVLLKELGRLHGRTSFTWNGEDETRGRQVWCKAAETVMKSQGHYHATVNYIHHNPVKHGYVKKWTDWPWSSATSFLEEHGREDAEKLWRQYPIGEYGQGWDDPEH